MLAISCAPFLVYSIFWDYSSTCTLFSSFTGTATSVTGGGKLSVSAQSSHRGAESHRVHVESSRVSMESSRVSIESSRDTTNIKTSSDSHTRYLHPTPATFLPGKTELLFVPTKIHQTFCPQQLQV